MKVLVLGGSGRTGALVVQSATAAGHEVTVMARDPGRVPPGPRLRVVTGDATNRTDVEDAVAGQDAVVSALGSPSLFGRQIATLAAELLVPAAEEAGVGRLIEMSAFGTGATSDQAGLLVRTAFATVLRGYHRDKTDADAIIRGSTLDWTIVQPTVLDDVPSRGPVTAVERLTGRGSRTVSRADVAEFLLACLTSTAWSRRTVVVTS